MSVENSQHNRIKFQNPTSLEDGEEQQKIKNRLGRGVYVHGVSDIGDGELEIALGNATPRDLSDAREQNNVLKFVTIRNVCTLYAEETGSGYYTVELPDREEMVEQIEDREEEIVDKLDFSMAQAIYKDVYNLPDVRNQLNPVLELLQWMRREGTLSISRLDAAQNSGSTRKYLELLDDLGYIDIVDGTANAGELLQSADLQSMDREQFGREFLGDVVQRGYYNMRDNLKLSMLGHYQKYAGAYYFDALQLGDHDLWLDIDKIAENINRRYNSSEDPLRVRSKLADLSRIGVVNQDGDYVQGTEDTYNQLATQAPSV